MTPLDEYIIGLQHGNICQKAAAIALEWGHVEGAYHKQWIIDQMLRVICGSAYQTVIDYFERYIQEWDEGIAP